MGVVSRRWMWVESMGGASGFGCKEVYRVPHITYPLLLLYLFFFAAASLLFVHKKNVFHSLYIQYLGRILHSSMIHCKCGARSGSPQLQWNPS